MDLTNIEKMTITISLDAFEKKLVSMFDSDDELEVGTALTHAAELKQRFLKELPENDRDTMLEIIDKQSF